MFNVFTGENSLSQRDKNFKGTIAFLDSGVGGFTILDKVKEKLPDYRLIYYFDRKNFPYGLKSDEQVTKVVAEAFQWLKSTYQPTLYVLACNTASTIALPHLRAVFKELIVGVVPSIKPAAELSVSGVIGVLATSGTLQRQYLNDLVRTFGQNKRFVFGSADGLVKIAEDYFLAKKNNALDDVSHHLKQIFSAEELRLMDTVVLGCTHYGHITGLLKQSAPSVAQWLDSAEAVAKRTGYLLALQSETKAGATSNDLSQHHSIVLSAPISAQEREALKRKYFDFVLVDRDDFLP